MRWLQRLRPLIGLLKWNEERSLLDRLANNKQYVEEEQSEAHPHGRRAENTRELKRCAH